MEDIRDLLSKDSSKKLKMRNHPDSGVYVEVHIAATVPGSLGCLGAACLLRPIWLRALC